MTRLNRESVLESGVALVAARGWPALSIRALAADLGVTPMALYRHVDDGDSLLEAVLERIVVPLTDVPAGDAIDAAFRTWAVMARSTLHPYNGVAQRLLTVWFDMPSMLGTIDDLLGIAIADGLDGFKAVAAVNALFVYVLMRVEAEQIVRSASVVRRALRLGAAQRPLPHLQRLSAHYTTAEFDAHFEYGLDVLLAGIAAKRAPA